MEAPSTGLTPQIALRQFTGGGRLYEGGDLFDPKVAERDGLSNYNMENLRKQCFTGALTRTNYQIAIGRRPPGSIGRGLDPKWLKEQGIIDDVPKVVAKPTSVVTASAPGEAILHRGCKVVPFKQGNFTRWEALDTDGRAMRAKRFQKADGAIAFIDATLGPVVAVAEHVDDAVAAEERTDGEHIQSGSVGPDLEGQD